MKKESLNSNVKGSVFCCTTKGQQSDYDQGRKKLKEKAQGKAQGKAQVRIKYGIMPHSWKMTDGLTTTGESL